MKTPPQRQSEQAGFFGGRPKETVVFRLRTDSGELVNCRFEGTLSGLLDQGDNVRVYGTSVGGVIEVSRIVDANGAVIAQSQCFVASVVFRDPCAPEVERFRRFRDEVLRRSAAGRLAIALYWRFGPTMAGFLSSRPKLCHATRWFLLRPLSQLLILQECEVGRNSQRSHGRKGSSRTR
ncbi:MAG: CFI-box-CTERM domain-containing protein [Pirellulaceae bacterium]